MSEQGHDAQMPEEGGRQPIFLLPGVVTAMVGLMVAIHLAATFVLNQEGQNQLIIWFAFLPLRIVAMGEDPSLGLPLIWTPFTHALLHGGWEHLLVNMAWLAIFATPVARRYGPVPTLLIFFVASAAGAAALPHRRCGTALTSWAPPVAWPGLPVRPCASSSSR